MSGPHHGCAPRSGSPSSPISPPIRSPTDCCPISPGTFTAPTRPGSAISRQALQSAHWQASVALSLIGGLRVARLMIGATVTWYAAASGVRAYANHAGRNRLSDAGRVLPKPDHDHHRGHPDAHRQRTFPRPGDGRAHARDLQPAARPARRRQPDRRDRLCRDRHALRVSRARAAAGNRAALAHATCGTFMRRPMQNEQSSARLCVWRTEVHFARKRYRLDPKM